jgi:hypothetical protein
MGPIIVDGRDLKATSTVCHPAVEIYKPGRELKVGNMTVMCLSFCLAPPWLKALALDVGMEFATLAATGRLVSRSPRSKPK